MFAMCVIICGCAATRGILYGHGAEYRAEYEQLKAAVLAANDPTTEATALREMGLWFKKRPYGYRLAAASQPNMNGVELTRLPPGQPVELRIHMKSDHEPRDGGFTFVPKDKMNLLLLEGKPINGNNPQLERTAAAVDFIDGRTSRLRRRGR